MVRQLKIHLQKIFLTAAIAVCLLVLSGSDLKAQTVLYEFSASWCSPCQKIAPLIHQLIQEGYPIKQVDMTEGPTALSKRLQVSSLPSFVLVKDGKPISKTVGALTRRQIDQMLRKANARPAPGLARAADARAGSRENPMSVKERARQMFAQGERNRGGGNQTFAPAAPVQQKPAMPFNVGSRNLAHAGHDHAGHDHAGHGQPIRATHLQAVAPPRRNQSRGRRDSSADQIEKSVRLRIDDAEGHSFGTGVVIDSRDGEALVLTCGHLFRDKRPQDKITVDLFRSINGNAQVVEQVVGELISFDLQRDLGLVAIRPKSKVSVAKVAKNVRTVRRGDSVFSVGCNRGAAPTVMRSRVTALNRYLGPPNIEASGAPIEGRSGGPLFNNQGEVVGICYAADYEGNEGLYAGTASIHAELKKLEKLGIALISESVPQVPRQISPAIVNNISASNNRVNQALALEPIVRGQSEPLTTIQDQNQQPPRRMLQREQPRGASIGTPPVTQNLSPSEQTAWNEIVSKSGNAEVVVIVRPADGSGKSEVLTLKNLSPQFVQKLRQNAAKKQPLLFYDAENKN